MCRSEMLGDPCCFGSLPVRSQCVRAVMRVVAGRLLLLAGGHLPRNRCVPLKADYHRIETLAGRCHLLQKGFFSKAEPITSTGKRWQIETSRCIDTRDIFPLASVSLFKLRFQFPTAEREDIKLENKTEVALSMEKERKPLIFFSPPFRHQSGGEEAGCGCSDS